MMLRHDQAALARQLDLRLVGKIHVPGATMLPLRRDIVSKILFQTASEIRC